MLLANIKPSFDLSESFLRGQTLIQGHYSAPSANLEINIAGDILPSDMHQTGCIYTHFLIPRKTFLMILQLDDTRIIALLH